jgi:hypothetical protein
VIAATDTYATIEELLEVVFSVGSVLSLYNEDRMPSQKSSETAARRVGGWCEMVTSMRGREPGSLGASTVGRRYQASQ